ncbi:MAG: hypothetical protein WC742_07540 [Gallionellaceae bacterium]|jgi:hypothetical protein
MMTVNTLRSVTTRCEKTTQRTDVQPFFRASAVEETLSQNQRGISKDAENVLIAQEQRERQAICSTLHQETYSDATMADSKKLEAELTHYRNMLDNMVRARTDRLDRRIAILESCNSTLGENYHKMHRMYLDLLIKTQDHE